MKPMKQSYAYIGLDTRPKKLKQETRLHSNKTSGLERIMGF